MGKLFLRILKDLEDFDLAKPAMLESELEDQVYQFLSSKGIEITRQVSEKKDRYDLICKSGNEIVCIELKVFTNTKDLKQFDRYYPQFKDGFIVLCWQANFTVRDLFNLVRDQSPIPIEMIELCKRYA